MAPSPDVIPADYGGREVVPVGGETSFEIVNSDPTVTNAHAGDDTNITQVYTVLASGSANIIPIRMNGATGLDVLCRYKADGTLTSGPKVVVIGLDRGGAPWQCVDKDGAKEWTLTPVAAADLTSSSVLGYTAFVSIPDVRNAYRCLILVKKAAVGTGFNNANGGRIMAKVV